MKTCLRCLIAKPGTSNYFERRSKNTDGLNNRCLLCTRELHREHCRTHRRKNPIQRRIKSSNSMAKIGRYSPLKMSLEELTDYLEKHSGICDMPSCNKEAKHIDHCHLTGKLRGHLCHNHNVGLGHFHDSESELMEAVGYLRGTA